MPKLSLPVIAGELKAAAAGDRQRAMAAFRNLGSETRLVIEPIEQAKNDPGPVVQQMAERLLVWLEENLIEPNAE